MRADDIAPVISFGQLFSGHRNEFSVIMLANSLMWFEPASDITADVIGKMLAANVQQPTATGAGKKTE